MRENLCVFVTDSRRPNPNFASCSVLVRREMISVMRSASISVLNKPGNGLGGRQSSSCFCSSSLPLSAFHLRRKSRPLLGGESEDEEVRCEGASPPAPCLFASPPPLHQLLLSPASAMALKHFFARPGMAAELPGVRMIPCSFPSVLVLCGFKDAPLTFCSNCSNSTRWATAWNFARSVSLLCSSSSLARASSAASFSLVMAAARSISLLSRSFLLLSDFLHCSCSSSSTSAATL
mmetsp:Transcript_18679/g.42745  ORF Transcript_18679/g.42745 Transcript_18679/m.42745 type:complete len:235 (+) Transcript_18679:1618-2322(+)